MADFSKFRTAVSGFNRSDVVNYIEELSMEHKKAIRKLTDERDRLIAENEALTEQNLRAKEDVDSLSEQVESLAAQSAELAAQLKAAEELLQEAPQAAEQPQPQPCAEEASLTRQELAAYRRAEQTERNAAIRARRISAQLFSLCEDARTRYTDSGEEIAALTADLSTGLARLQDVFAEVQVIFDDAQNAFDDMQLPQTDADEDTEA